MCWGLLLFRFPCGFHSSALLTTCPSGLLNVWPIHAAPNSFLISCFISRCPVCLQSSLLLIFLGHQICKIFLKLLLMNTCTLCSNPLVSLQFSEPYKSTTLTFDSKTLSLVLVVSDVDRLIYWSQHGKCLSCLSTSCLDVLVSVSFLVYNAPKVCELIHFLNPPPGIDTPSPRLVAIHTDQRCLGGIDLQAYLPTLYLQDPCLMTHILYSVRK